MRFSTVFSMLAVLFSAGCARQTPPPVSTPKGNVDTLPAFVLDPASATEQGDGTVMRTYHGCSATYVAPHLLLTSATAFPETASGDRRRHVPVIVRASDGSFLHVTGVAYLNGGDGIALVRTSEAGHPVALSELATPRETLTAVGFHFGPVPADHSLAPTEQYQQQVTPEPEPYSSGGTFIRFRVAPKLGEGSCGIPLLDSDGKLAGMVHERHGEWMSVVSAPSIAEAVKRAQ